jgi:hypothetical protein
MLADYRRPGRPKGSRDRVPRKNTAKRAASIRHIIDTSVEMEESIGFDCCDGKIHIIEELETADNKSGYPFYEELFSGITTKFTPQNDPLYAEWTF